MAGRSTVTISIAANLVGLILAVLRCHLAGKSNGVPQETMTICMFRRDDARLVEVELQIERSFRNGAEELLVTHLRDCEPCRRFK